MMMMMMMVVMMIMMSILINILIAYPPIFKSLLWKPRPSFGSSDAEPGLGVLGSACAEGAENHTASDP